jgi:hypothetical protein
MLIFMVCIDNQPFHWSDPSSPESSSSSYLAKVISH